MNAEPGVERLISEWLLEEAPDGAPDRILETAARTIDRTKQRHFGAAWREPMLISSGRLVAAAVVIVAVIAGAAWLGRSTAGVAGPPASTSTPSPSTPSPRASVTLESYRAARDAICSPASSTAQTLNDQLTGIYDPATTGEQRAAKINAMQELVDLLASDLGSLRAMDVPPELIAEHATDIARHEDTRAVLVNEIELLKSGKLAEAEAVDLTTDPINAGVGAFETKYSLATCP